MRFMVRSSTPLTVTWLTMTFTFNIDLNKPILGMKGLVHPDGWLLRLWTWCHLFLFRVR